MLRKVSSLDHPNLLKSSEKFPYQGFRRLVPEVLHKDLTSLDLAIEKKPCSSWNSLRNRLGSTLALDAPSDVGILHPDIKLDSIMLVGKGDLKVKRSAFGLAPPAREAQLGMTAARFMQAPTRLLCCCTLLFETFLVPPADVSSAALVVPHQVSRNTPRPALQPPP